MKELSDIIKPPVKPGESGKTWHKDVDASIMRMKAENKSYVKIASELGNGLSKYDIYNRWTRHLKNKLQ